jgi:hypothetical protein
MVAKDRFTWSEGVLKEVEFERESRDAAFRYGVPLGMSLRYLEVPREYVDPATGTRYVVIADRPSSRYSIALSSDGRVWGISRQNRITLINGSLGAFAGCMNAALAAKDRIASAQDRGDLAALDADQISLRDQFQMMSLGA